MVLAFMIAQAWNANTPHYRHHHYHQLPHVFRVAGKR